VIFGSLPDVNFLTTSFGPVEKLGTAECVVNEDIGEFDALLSAECDESEIAGSGADEETSA
jgi:hypothetical protein